MGILIGIAVYAAWMVAIAIFGGWALLVMAGGFALLVLCGIVHGALEQRAYRKTVERLMALERASSWREWTLPAPESYALFAGVTKIESDAFKLGLMQLIAMGALSADGDGTTLERGQTPIDARAGSLAAVYGVWAACAEQPVHESEGQVVEAQTKEAE